MSYSQALEAAGAEVLAYKEFGSYQGDWYAKVNLGGAAILIGGAFGSCSGCDAFQAEFGWEDEDQPDYHERLAAFGRKYLTDPLDPVKARADAVEQSVWDMDSLDVIRWFDEHFPVAT